MKSRTYDQVRSDFEHLETKARCHDCAWVEERFEDFLKNPTKKYAKDIYISLIGQWFLERNFESTIIDTPDFAKDIDDRVHEIAQIYGCDFEESDHK